MEGQEIMAIMAAEEDQKEHMDRPKEGEAEGTLDTGRTSILTGWMLLSLLLTA